MLSHLDRSIFPDRCEVIEVIPSQRYVYPIFKNGSTTLFWEARQLGWKIKFNEQIKKLKSIDVVLREPHERFVSGISTFVQHTIRDNPDLDLNTVIWFAKNYLFLNRHYCPQFLWLVNLAKYLGTDAQLNFIGMEDIKSITDSVTQPLGITAPDPTLISQVEDLPHNKMYQQIDNILFQDCIGKSMTFNEVIKYIQQADPVVYEYVVGHSRKILNVLS